MLQVMIARGEMPGLAPLCEDAVNETLTFKSCNAIYFWPLLFKRNPYGETGGLDRFAILSRLVA